MRRLARFMPKQISSQLLALMLIVVVVFNIGMASTFLLIHSFAPLPHGPHREIQPDHAQAVGDPSIQRLMLEDRGPPHEPPLFGIGPPMIATIIFLTTSLSLLGLWATRALVAPLKTFVRAAENYGTGGNTTVLAEQGPTEIKALARALNSMQTRIADLVEERARMLAAVGHDLRTPITRLRLRAEFMTDVSEQRRMLADLDHMEALVRGALMHLQDGVTGEPVVVTDLPSLLQTIADQFADLGTEVTCLGPQHMAVRLRPHEFQRAVANLVENAVRYGTAPTIDIQCNDIGEIEIRVEDSGPGIAEALRDKVLEPFVRGDAARTMNEHEGFGLGLAIARSIAEAHGGRLELRDRQPTGLTAAIILPPDAMVSGTNSQDASR